MAYIVRQKIHGRIYLYEVVNTWDKEKGQPRQKRKYIGPEEKIYNKSKDNPVIEQEVKEKIEERTDPEKQIKANIAEKTVCVKPSDVVSKTYGDIFLIRHLQKTLGITDLLKKHFGDHYKEMLVVSAFMIEGSLSSYLFPYWHEEHYLEDVKKLHSSELSELYAYSGQHERERLDFLKDWVQHLNPTSGIYYDITSISSYSTNIESVEWGYNRDKEHLPQINLGFTHCSKTSLPLSYTVHPGSIVDVSTLKNVIKTFHVFGLKDLFFILDRGFCSVANLLEMHRTEIHFIQPLSFSLKKAKALVTKHITNIGKSENAFCFKEEVLYHVSDQIEFEGITFKAHLFYNEKTAVDYKHYLYKGLLKIEHEIKQRDVFKDDRERKKYLENNIDCTYRKFFEIKDTAIIRNKEAIEEALARAGMFIFVVNGKQFTPENIIEAYRNRDRIEKDIDSLKNQIDTNRLRAHNQDTMNGRLFIKFLSLIITTQLMNIIKGDEKLKKYSINEILAELRKIKINCFDKKNKFMTELSKKQKLIFKAFKIDINTIFTST